MPPTVLLEQLRAAGVDKKVATDSLSDADKSRLLEYLRKMHGSAEAKNKITLTRKHTSEIKKADATGKYRTVQVEVRKKRVFVKREAGEGAPVEAPAPVAPAPAPAAPAAPAIDAKQIELREEEARRQQQLADIQATELREKQEREKREAEQKAAEAAAAATPAATTLHAPKPATGDAKTDKKPKKAKTTTILRDDSVR